MSSCLLADFIGENMESILQAWEDFERPSSRQVPGPGQAARQRGHGCGKTHAQARLLSGHTVVQLVSEYRALRSSVLSTALKMRRSRSVGEHADDIVGQQPRPGHSSRKAVLHFRSAAADRGQQQRLYRAYQPRHRSVHFTRNRQGARRDHARGIGCRTGHDVHGDDAAPAALAGGPRGVRATRAGQAPRARLRASSANWRRRASGADATLPARRFSSRPYACPVSRIAFLPCS